MSATDDTDEASADGSERVIALIQKGFGLLSGVVMLVLSVVGILLDGVPEQTMGLGVMATAVLLGLVVVAVTMTSVSTKVQSAIYAVIAMVALLGFGMGLAIELSVLMIISLFAGAMLLFCSAAFPAVGRKMMASV